MRHKWHMVIVDPRRLSRREERALRLGQAGREDNKKILWVSCSGCGARVTTTQDLIDSDRVHEGWAGLLGDCRAEQVRQVMEE